LRWRFRFRRAKNRIKRPVRLVLGLSALTLLIYWVIALILIRLGDMTYEHAFHWNLWLIGICPAVDFVCVGLQLVNNYGQPKRVKTQLKRIILFCLGLGLIAYALVVSIEWRKEAMLNAMDFDGYEMLGAIQLGVVIGVAVIVVLSLLWGAYTGWYAFYRRYPVRL
jgi:hypothetical protein